MTTRTSVVKLEIPDGEDLSLIRNLNILEATNEPASWKMILLKSR